MRIQTKLGLILFLLSFGVIAAAGIFSTITLDDYFRARTLGELRTQAGEAEFFIRSLPDSSARTAIRGFAEAAHLRLTLITREGVVIFDSEVSSDSLGHVENHLARPEVQEALSSGSGSAERKSATIGHELLYFARRIDTPFPSPTGVAAAAFLRLAMPLTEVNEMLAGIRSKIIVASSIVLLLVVLTSVVVARRLASPVVRMERIAAEIRGGRYDRRIPVASRDEIGRLAETLNGMIDRLNDDIAQLRKLERVRSEFLGNVSHELRTPIFAIQGMLETLLSGALDDPAVNRGFVERALQNTLRLNALLVDLIEISRIQSGDMKLSFRYFPLDEFLRQVVAEMAPIARGREIGLALGDAPHADVLGDKERLKQVMANLIDNAVKYNAPGGRVDVAARAVDGRVEISVTDTGVGIAAEHLPRIFERFYRVDRERSREAGGTGLGLAIVKHIVEAHGSRVDVRSTPGKGSTFIFTLRTGSA